jgi:sulfur-oxidizing protein SoxZ
MANPEPRVQVPESVLEGAPFQVKALINHPMETGLRHDDRGQSIPRRIINRFVCRHDGIEVFSVDLHEAVSANPFIEFRLRATATGRLEFIWEEDGGRIYALAHRLVVK